MTDTAPTTPKADIGDIDPRLLLGCAFFGMAVGVFVGIKISKLSKPKPCADCEKTRFTQVPAYTPPPGPPGSGPVWVPGPRPAPNGQQYRDAPPIVDIPGGNPNAGMISFDRSASPKLADPVPGFRAPIADDNTAVQF